MRRFSPPLESWTSPAQAGQTRRHQAGSDASLAQRIGSDGKAGGRRVEECRPGIGGIHQMTRIPRSLSASTFSDATEGPPPPCHEYGTFDPAAKSVGPENY